MKNIKLLLMGLLACVSLQGLQATEYDMTELNQKVKTVTDKKLDVFISEIEIQDLFDSQEFKDLEVVCKRDWSDIVDNLDLIEGGDKEKNLVFWGMGQLSAADYIALIENITTKYEADSVSEKLLNEVMFPHGKMRAFIADNYAHARVNLVLNRVKNKSADISMKGRITRILTGKDKSTLDSYREAHAGLPEGNIPKILLGE